MMSQWFSTCPTERQKNFDTQYPTILHYAAAHGLSEFCAALLEFPVSSRAFRIRNSDGLDPAELAAERGFDELENYIIDFMVRLPCEFWKEIAPVSRSVSLNLSDSLHLISSKFISNRVDCQRSEKRSKTHKRLTERLLILQNRTKRANFRRSPLFQATYNEKTEKRAINSTFLVSVGCVRLAAGKGHLTDSISCLFFPSASLSHPTDTK